MKHTIYLFNSYLKDCHKQNILKKENIPVLPEICEQFKKWMVYEKSYSNSKISRDINYCIKFLYWCKKNKRKIINKILPKEIEEFLFEKRKGMAGNRSIMTSLRTFLTFCYEKNITSQPLYFSVPTIKKRKYKDLPKAISEKEAIRYLSTINRSTACGKRLFAVSIIVYTYGVRIGQISKLKLEDVDWKANEIYFSALKGGKGTRHPLTSNVGNALLDYIKSARLRTLKYNEIFLTIRAPIIPVSSPLLRFYMYIFMKKYKINSPRRGACCFRHAFVSRLLESGNSFKHIADLLGHRYIDTTFIYSKIDYKSLKEVALDLPGEL